MEIEILDDEPIPAGPDRTPENLAILTAAAKMKVGQRIVLPFDTSRYAITMLRKALPHIKWVTRWRTTGLHIWRKT